MNIQKEKCIEKWKCGCEADKRIANASNIFETWFSQIPDEYKEISSILIQNLEYYSRPTTNKWLKILHEKLIQNPTVTDENTIYAFIKSKDGKSNSSNDYWTEYKLINEINPELCYENINAIEDEQWEYIQNIIFIDDFSGSAKSFIDELKKCETRYNRKDIFFITINMMEFATDQIAQYASEKGFNIYPIFAFIQQKAFERDLFEDNNRTKEDIISLSNSLKIPKNEHLGYRDSQALVAFYNNTPNNTIGFIRYDTDTYQSLFPRNHNPKPTWQTMKRKKKVHKINNYNNLIKSGE